MTDGTESNQGVAATPSPLKVLMISGPSATGKTFLTLQRLSLHYRVATESMDRLYRLALAAAGIPFGKRVEDDPKKDPVSIYKAAHDLRTEGEFTPETVAIFFSHLELAIRERLELADTLGLAMVFEGYTLRFPDEATRVMAAAREVADDSQVVRATLRPTKDTWEERRAGKREQQGRPRPPALEQDDYERRMAALTTAEGVIDFALRDEDDFRRLIDDVLGLERLQLTSESLGFIASIDGDDSQVARSKINAVERDRLIADLLGVLRGRQAIMDEKEALERESAELSYLLDERRTEVDRLQTEHREAVIELAERDRLLAQATEEVTERIEEAGAAELRAREVETEAERLREVLAEWEQAITKQMQTLAAVRRDVERAASSRSWRFGHGLLRLLRTLTFRRTQGKGALEVALERLPVAQPGEAAAAAPALPAPAAIEERRVPAAGIERDGGSADVVERAGSAAPDERPAQGDVTRPKRRRGPPPQAGPVSVSESTEVAVQRSFLSRYERALGHPDPLPAALAQSGIAFPVDHQAILRRRNDDTASPSVDVILPVHNSLAELHECLWSLLSKTGHPFHLIVVNDGSDEQTSEYLRDFASRNEGVTLIHNQLPPHGYALAANVGIRASRSDYAVMLSSESVVTLGWLERVISCAASDERLGVVGPVSGAFGRPADPPDGNGSAVPNPLPDWLTPDGMALIVSSLSERAMPRVPVVGGPCYAIKRAVIEAIGVFDAERFAEGHFEDADFSYRAAQAGFELAIADDAYVHRAESITNDSNGRPPLVEAHRRAWISKHGEAEIRKQAEAFDANGSLSRLHAAVETLTADASRFEQGLGAILEEPLSVSYVLSGVSERGGGGIESIREAVTGLRTLGVPAVIGVLERDLQRAGEAWPDAADAIFSFRDEDELLDKTSGADVIVATDFKSVAMLEGLRRSREDFLAAYYLQDYEPFFAETRSETPGEAEAAYTAIDKQILLADSHWLCGLVGRLHGVHVNKVEPGIDPSLVGFEKPETDDSAPVRVATMILPGVAQSQPLMALRLLRRLKDELPGQVEVVTVGGDPADFARGEEQNWEGIERVGTVGQSELRATLARSDVLLDCSVYQPPGRTSLEAMACGCTAILPRLGGASEFARDDVNAVLVDTSDEDATYGALVDLVSDRTRLERLQAKAAEAASRFSPIRAGLSGYALFEYEHSRLLGDASATLERRDPGPV